MKLPFFKKRNSRPKSSFKKYDSIARERKKNLAKERIKSLNVGVDIKRSKFPKKLLIIPGVVILVILIFFLFSSALFKVKNINISGDKAKENSMLQDLDKLKGRNIFLLRNSEIEGVIRDKYENIESVFVYKYMPDKIEVEIVQSLPALVFSSFAKTTLVKRDGSSLGNLPSISELKLLDYEVQILNGTKDFNAQYIKDSFLSDLPDDAARKAFKWEEVKEEDKESRYLKIHDDINKRVLDYRLSIINALKNTDYSTLPFFFSYVPYSENKDFFDAALEVSDELKFRSLNAIDNTFTSQYTLEEKLDNEKRILFSTRRAITEQFKDLDSIIFYGRFPSSRVIDLRSEKYSIIR